MKVICSVGKQGRYWWGVNMEVMSGWARQPLPQLIALLRIMTHRQPIRANGHLHLHLLIFHAECRVFSTHIDNTQKLHEHRPERMHKAYPYGFTHVNLSNSCKNILNLRKSCIDSTGFMRFILCVLTVESSPLEIQHVGEVHMPQFSAECLRASHLTVRPSVCLSHWICVIT